MAKKKKTTATTPPDKTSRQRAPARSKKKRKKKSTKAAAAATARDAFPIVVIGASAGGLEALKQLLRAVPPDCGMAFVLVPHLDPRHESLMTEILSRQTSLTVQEAQDGVAVAPGNVYVIPPDEFLEIRNRKLVVHKAELAHRGFTAVDHAFSSTARDQKSEAIGIILSGTGSHGTLGAQEIKLAGGLVLVQDPSTAISDQMPLSAISAGVADHVLAPAQMPATIVHYVNHWNPSLDNKDSKVEPGANAVRRAIAILQTRGKHEIRHYRKNMLLRRIQRRMALVQLTDIDEYIQRLRQDAEEVEALCRDVMIGVTAFLRDPDAFKALAQHVLPELVERATADQPVRIWVPGCATGEEAYTIGMLLLEQFHAKDRTPNFLIFATDPDRRSLDVARQGIYSENHIAVLSPERRERFFSRLEGERFKIGRQLRDTIVFAEQNLLTDAPFSKLDLISCRNVLIYLEPEVQEKILSVLHFALDDGGYLLLGPSESVSRTSELFEPISTKWRLFRRLGPARREPVPIPILAGAGRRGRADAFPAVPRSRVNYSELMQKVLTEDFAPASVLIDQNFDILAVQGQLVDFIEFPPGEMTKNLLDMALPGLRLRIRSACQHALKDGRSVTETGVRVKRRGGYAQCSITARPVPESPGGRSLMLVVFEDAREAAKPEAPVDTAPNSAHTSMIEQLQSELRATREDLQSTIEQLETSNEEMKSSNEEVMSMNEELQSANEELETSKEELQSLNEELSTVNSQLQDKIEDLDAANSDLTNLMSAANVPTVFLDAELRIKRFTKGDARLFNFIDSDVGRSLRDFAPRFSDDKLLDDCDTVIRSAVPLEKEIRTDDGRFFLRRALPYRGSGDKVDGIVISFFDISSRIGAEAEVRHLASVLRDSNDAVIICSLDGRITGWNRGAAKCYGYSQDEALELEFRQIVPPDYRKKAATAVERLLENEDVPPYESQRLTKTGRIVDVEVTITLLKDERGNPLGLARTERDITARLQREQEIRHLQGDLERRVQERTRALKESGHRIRAILDATADAIVTIGGDGTIETFNKAAEVMFGYSADEALGRNVAILMGEPYRSEHAYYLAHYAETGESRLLGTVRDLIGRRKDGGEFPIQLSVMPVAGLGLFTGVIRDVSEQRTLQEEIIRVAATEQRRIGEELHDSSQQELTGLGLLAQHLVDSSMASDREELRCIAERLADGIALANRHIRQLARGLVPVAVDAEGLMAALAELADSTGKEAGIDCRFVCPAPVDPGDDMTALHLYRIAQEAVSNAIKHAEPSAIMIELKTDHDEISLVVRDDGIGISPQAREKGGLGMRLMSHRCGMIGGSLSVSAINPGTEVLCRVPVLGRMERP